MSLLSYRRLRELVESGVINADVENINGASIDITLGDKLLVEYAGRYVDLAAKDNIEVAEMVFTQESPFVLVPGQFVLASSVETFNLPNNIAGEYKLKSSMARNGLQHLLAD